MLEDLEAAMRESRALAVKTRAAAAPAPRQAHRPGRFHTIVFAVVAALGGFAVALYLVARAEGGTTSSGDEPARSPVGKAATAPDSSSSAQSPAPDVRPEAASSAPLPQRKAPAAPPATDLKAHDLQKPSSKRSAPSASSGVAGGLGLSTREP
jgi:hypothetical protein